MNEGSVFNPFFIFCQKTQHHSFPAQINCEKSATNFAHCAASYGNGTSVIYILSLVFTFCNI